MLCFDAEHRASRTSEWSTEVFQAASPLLLSPLLLDWMVDHCKDYTPYLGNILRRSICSSPENTRAMAEMRSPAQAVRP